MMNDVMRKEAEAQFEESDAHMSDATFNGTEELVKNRPDRVIVNLFRENASLHAEVARLREIVSKSADTFRLSKIAWLSIGDRKSAKAMELAEQGCRAYDKEG